MTPLGKRLQKCRLRRGLTVRDLAERIGKTAGYVTKIEVRGEIPTPELLCVLAEVFGLDPEELLKLAKSSQLKKTECEIEAKHSAALEMYRKGKK